MLSRFAAVTLGSAALLFTAVASAPARISNSCGPCPFVAAIKDGSRTVLLQAVATSTPARRSQMRPFWATDRLTWRLTFHGLDTGVSRATLRLGTIGSPGRYLFTLCGPCSSGAHGKVALGNRLAGAVTYRLECPGAPFQPGGRSVRHSTFFSQIRGPHDSRASSEPARPTSTSTGTPARLRDTEEPLRRGCSASWLNTPAADATDEP